MSEVREFWLFSEGKGTKDPDYQMLKPDDSLISEFIHELITTFNSHAERVVFSLLPMGEKK